MTDNIKKEFAYLLCILCLTGFSLVCHFYARTRRSEITGEIATVLGIICIVLSLFVFIQYWKEWKGKSNENNARHIKK